jgi:hypothetical protein
MTKNITLAIDEQLLRQARRYAAERETTVNGLVRDYLTRLVAQRDRALQARQALAKLSETSDWQPASESWRWNREDLYDRGGVPGHQHPDLRGVPPEDGRKKKKARG